MRFRNAKVELLRKVGAHDSLSALEKQVDLLTRLVLQMAELIPVESRPDMAAKFAKLIDDTGANHGKTDDDVIGQIVKFKGFMRACQAGYFAQRDGAV